MHKEILSDKQKELLPLLKTISKDFYLVGGTAIALQIGHRRSIDFDLFSFKPFDNKDISKKVRRTVKITKVLVNKLGEFTFFCEDVKITFYNYQFQIEYSESLDDIIKMPDILTLAAMKAYALGQRAKWKDYIDLYFIIKNYHKIKEIVKKAKQIFGNEFNEKLFRSQLAYFKDINYAEEIKYMKGFEVKDEVVKKELTKFSISF